MSRLEQIRKLIEELKAYRKYLVNLQTANMLKLTNNVNIQGKKDDELKHIL